MSAVYLDDYLPRVPPLPQRLRQACAIDDSVDGDLDSIEPSPTFRQMLALGRAIRERCKRIRQLAPRPRSFFG